MTKKTLLGLLTAVAVFAGTTVAYAGGGESGSMKGPYLHPKQVEMMMKMMMTMPPDSVDASIERGRKLYTDSTLGNNKTGLSCNSCHPNGGSVGGTAAMEWKGMTMHPKVPTLKSAAAHFPAPRGPMKAVVTLKGMNNMCIMSFLKGLPLNENSQQSTDLASYVTSFSKGESIAPGHPPVAP